MTYLSILKTYLSHSNASFSLRTIDNLLFEKTENEIFSINFPKENIIFDGIKAGDKSGKNSWHELEKK